MGPAIIPRLILLLLFFWLSVSRTFFSERNPSFDMVKRLSQLDDERSKLVFFLSCVFSEGVWEGTITFDTLLLSDNLSKSKCL